MLPAPPRTPAPPTGAQHSPMQATFHALAARSLAGRGGRPVSPGSAPHAGAPVAAKPPAAPMLPMMGR